MHLAYGESLRTLAQSVFSPQEGDGHPNVIHLSISEFVSRFVLIQEIAIID